MKQLLLMIFSIILPMQILIAKPDIIINAIDMRFVTIPSGTFQMGLKDRSAAIWEMKTPDPEAFADEQPMHSVQITQPFLLGQTEVTQSQWLRVMENRPGPTEYWQQKDWENLPVVGISWYMAQRFTEELSRLDTEYNYRLPTEAEWEYAARAGTLSLRPMATDQLVNYAWFIDNSGDHPHPVASRQANRYGVYDLLGNVWEWVADWYAPHSYGDGSLRSDPVGVTQGRARVRRGGSYHCPLHQTRPGFRGASTPETAYSVTGLRVVAIQ